MFWGTWTAIFYMFWGALTANFACDDIVSHTTGNGC